MFNSDNPQLAFIDKDTVIEIKQSTLGVFCNNKCNGQGVYLNEENVIIDCECLVLFKKKIINIGANIPEKYWDFTFRNLNKPFSDKNADTLAIIKMYCDKIDAMVQGGYGIFFQGASGLAKSAFAAYILKEAIKKDIVCYYTSMSQLTRSIFESSRDETSKARLKWIKRYVQILVVDEIEKDYDISNAQSYIGSQVNDFFRTIYEKKKTLLLTSNLSKEAIRKNNLQSSNIIDRFNELIELIFVGDSFRNPNEALEILRRS